MHNILLIDDFFRIPVNYEPNLIPYKNIVIEKEIQDDLDDLIKSIENDLGYYNLILKSGYRSIEEQEDLFSAREYQFKEMGCKNPFRRTLTRVGIPGFSEHHTGLAIDIISEDTTNYEAFGDTESGRWLAENSWKYGFALRFPEDKCIVTCTDYEPWHFTYVGKPLAYYCYHYNKTLNEIHLDMRYSGSLEFDFELRHYELIPVRKWEEAETENEIILRGTEHYNVKMIETQR